MASFSPEVKKYRLEDGGSYFFQPESIDDYEQDKLTVSDDKCIFDKIHQKITTKTNYQMKNQITKSTIDGRPK